MHIISQTPLGPLTLVRYLCIRHRSQADAVAAC
jgi:hypothetical protein